MNKKKAHKRGASVRTDITSQPDERLRGLILLSTVRKIPVSTRHRKSKRKTKIEEGAIPRKWKKVCLVDFLCLLFEKQLFCWRCFPRIEQALDFSTRNWTQTQLLVRSSSSPHEPRVAFNWLKKKKTSNFGHTMYIISSNQKNK